MNRFSCKRFWEIGPIFLILLLPGGAFGRSIHEGRMNEAFGPADEVDQLFTSMGAKSSPLYLCDSTLGGIEYQPPATIDCNMEPADNDSTAVVDLTVFWNDLEHHSIKGYECSATKDKVSVVYKVYHFFASTESLEHLKINDKECWDMVNTKIAPNGKKIMHVSDTVWETGDHKETVIPYFFFAPTWHTEVTNYRVQQLKIGITEVDGMIKTTAFTTTPCHYSQASCTTSTGMLVWKSEDVKTCRLLEGEQSNCLFRNGTDGIRLTCPDLKLSLHNYELVSMCGTWFGHSQGIYFLQNEERKFDSKMATPDKVRGIMTRPRQKRESSGKKIHPFEAEIKANLNYLYETMRKGTADAVWKLEQKICEINKRQVEMMSALAQSGHPSLSTRFMYHNPALRAEFVGDLLMVYECIPVYEYMFLERETCTFQWPVQYVFRHIVYTGFVEPQTHTIVHVPTNQSVSALEDCKKFFFQADEYVVQLAQNRAFRVHVEPLPQPGMSDLHKQMLPELTFIPTGNLKASSDDDIDSIYHIMREMQQRHMTGKQIRGDFHIKTTKESFFSGFSSMLGSSYSFFGDLAGNVFGALKDLVIWGAIIFGTFFFLMVMVQTGLMTSFLQMPIFILKGISSGIVSCFSMKGLRCLKKKVKKGLKRITKQRRSEHYQASAPRMY